MIIRRFLFPFAISLIASLALTISASASDSANQITLTCRGNLPPTGVTSTMTDYDTLQKLKALCDDQGGTGTVDVVQVISINMHLTSEIREIYKGEALEWVAVTVTIPCNVPGCDFPEITFTTFELVKREAGKTVEVLICPTEYSYAYYIDGDFVGQTSIGGGTCVWRSRHSS